MKPGAARLGPAVLALLLGAAPATAQRTPSASLVAAARSVTREVAALRHLPLERPIRFQVSDRSTIREYARASLDREMTPGQWSAYGLLLAHCGLVPPGTDLRDLVQRLYVEQIAGYYDPHEKTFYLADWLPRLLQNGVVAHEATHALQDQHFDLDRWLRVEAPTEDGALARAAVTEGDAMAAMMAYLLVPSGVKVTELPDMATLMRGQAGRIGAAYPTFDRAPPALQRLLLFPYVEGTDFVLTALRHGGWDAVDRLYADPPASTEQILHPRRYWETRDDPTPLDTPGGEPGDSLLVEGSWGELGTGLVLAAALADSTAEPAARGWDGDRYALRRGADGSLRYAWSLVWDSPADAERFAGTYAQAVVRRFPGPARIATGEGRFAFAGSGRRVEVVREGSRVEVREVQRR